MPTSERWLIVGSSGHIGRALTEWSHQCGMSLVLTARDGSRAIAGALPLDLATDVAGWLPPDGITVAFLLAAVTSLEQCRNHPIDSRRVNVDGTLALARVLHERGSHLVFPSTNLVFDGAVPQCRADEPVCPLTEYGRQKADVERELLAWGERVCVVRLTKVITPDMPLLAGWVRALRDGEVIHPFADMVMAPVPVGFTTRVLAAVAQERLSGIVQVSAERDITYSAAARHLARCLGVDDGLVQPVRAQDAGVVPEARPRHTALDVSRLREEFGLHPPEAASALEVVLDP